MMIGAQRVEVYASRLLTSDVKAGLAGRDESRRKSMPNRPNDRVFAMKFANVYPLYVQKAERKNRTKEEVDQIICWLTGYDQGGLQQQIEQENDLETFFAQSPDIHS